MVGFGWMEENKKSGGGDVRASRPAIGDGISWTILCKRGEAEALLGARRSQSDEP